MRTRCTTPSRCHGQRAPTTLTHCQCVPAAPPPSRCHCQRAPTRQTRSHTAVHTRCTTSLTPVEIKQRTRRGCRSIQRSKTCTAQPERMQNLEEGGSPDSLRTGPPWLAPHFRFVRLCQPLNFLKRPSAANKPFSYVSPLQTSLLKRNSLTMPLYGTTEPVYGMSAKIDSLRDDYNIFTQPLVRF